MKDREYRSKTYTVYYRLELEVGAVRCDNTIAVYTGYQLLLSFRSCATTDDGFVLSLPDS